MNLSLESLVTLFHDFNIWIGLGVLVMYAITDALYAHYTLAVAEHRPLVAANTSAIIHFLIALGVLSYVDNFLYIIPIAIGSWIGTYVLIKKKITRL